MVNLLPERPGRGFAFELVSSTRVWSFAARRAEQGRDRCTGVPVGTSTASSRAPPLIWQAHTAEERSAWMAQVQQQVRDLLAAYKHRGKPHSIA
jgi:hypothetical protein